MNLAMVTQVNQSNITSPSLAMFQQIEKQRLNSTKYHPYSTKMTRAQQLYFIIGFDWLLRQLLQLTLGKFFLFWECLNAVESLNMLNLNEHYSVVINPQTSLP